jgi:archaea-specific DNA-binding protein
VSTWTRNIAYIQINNKKGVKKMTEETTPKPAAEKTEESTLKQVAEGSEKSIPKTVAEPKKTTKKPVEKKPDVIFIGNKPPMSYVMAVMTALSSGAITEITLKARGRAITTAVDVAEITRTRFIKDLRVTAIGIGTEEMPAREGDNRSRNVSTLEIKLAKK